jgi:hypothetical protein
VASGRASAGRDAPEPATRSAGGTSSAAPGGTGVTDRTGASVHPDATGGSGGTAPSGTAVGAPADTGVPVDRSAAVQGRTPSAFTPRQLARLDEALTMSSRETGIDFSVYVGRLEEPTRRHAEELHARLGATAPNGVLLAVSPAQRVLHIVTGEVSSRRLRDRSCALAALSMQASFSGGDLVGGIVNGLRMLSDQAGHLTSHRSPG